MLVLLQNTIRLALLLLVQILVMNNIHFLGFVNPYIYVLAILLWPARLDRKLAMTLALVIGLILDTFNNTPGVHTSASVLVAYLRKPFINAIVDLEEGANPTPSLRSFGISKFIKYILILVFIHHFTLFMLEVFSFDNFGITLLRTIVNTLITIIILLGIQSFTKE